MFDFLKGGNDLRVTLTRGLGPYFPGETIEATIDIEVKKSLKVTEGRVALICKEESEYIKTETDSDGETTRTETWDVTEYPFAQQTFRREGVITSNQTYTFNAVVPDPTLPTFNGGKIVRVKWYVKATLDRKRAVDLNAEAEVVMLLAPTGDSAPGVFGESSESDEADLAFDLPGKEWVSGEALTGQLIIQPWKDFDVTEIRLELERREDVQFGNNVWEEKQTVQLASETKIEMGVSLTYPFQITVPAPCPPSWAPLEERPDITQMLAEGYRRSTVPLYSESWSTTWKLKAILARPMRKDTYVEDEVFIYTGRRE